ncbi:MAG: hypothetical protein KKA32_14760 [Actinobacteria bacterium]|nr:hypothetical protein [Actinomycetota bacterium]
MDLVLERADGALVGGHLGGAALQDGRRRCQGNAAYLLGGICVLPRASVVCGLGDSLQRIRKDGELRVQTLVGLRQVLNEDRNQSRIEHVGVHSAYHVAEATIPVEGAGTRSGVRAAGRMPGISAVNWRSRSWRQFGPLGREPSMRSAIKTKMRSNPA